MKDWVTMVTSNIRVPPLPRRYLQETVRGRSAVEPKRTYGMLSVRYLDDSVTGPRIFGEESIDRT
jgi:hypothetical protein